jgi:hypothetical protein
MTSIDSPKAPSQRRTMFTIACAAVMAAVAWAFDALAMLTGYCYPPGTEWLKRYRTGADAPVVVASRRMLADETPELDPQAPERVAAALERTLQEMKRRFNHSSDKPQGELAEVHRRLFDKLARYADRPAVRQAVDLRRNLESDGVLGPPRKADG